MDETLDDIITRGIHSIDPRIKEKLKHATLAKTNTCGGTYLHSGEFTPEEIEKIEKAFADE